MSKATELDKKLVDAQHEKYLDMLIIGQPITGKDIPKATYVSMMNMLNPMKLINLMQKHKVATSIKILGDFPIDANRNRFVEESVEAGADYLFFMDMDQTFPSDTLERLFEVISDEKPIVSGMYFLKSEPYSPVMGRYVDWDDDLIPYKEQFTKFGLINPNGQQNIMWRSFTYWDNTVPFQADVIGLGCVLMKTSIFKNLEKPYFRYIADPRPQEKFRHKTMDEVMHFCAQLKRLNIPIWIDPKVQCGHLTIIESNIDIFTQYRDSQFDLSAKKDPQKFMELSKKFIDVRKEQRDGSRIPEPTPVA